MSNPILIHLSLMNPESNHRVFQSTSSRASRPAMRSTVITAATFLVGQACRQFCFTNILASMWALWDGHIDVIFPLLETQLGHEELCIINEGSVSSRLQKLDCLS